MKKLFLVSLISSTIFTTACNWAPLSGLGEKVRVLEPHEINSCVKKGKTTVSVKDKIIGVERNKKTMQKELERLARNAAPDINGDTVVAASPIKNGQQTFSVYKCVDPNN